MMRRLFSKKTYIVFGILCCVFMWLQFGMESYAFTRTTGEVTGSSVKVRKEASTESEMVASVRAGDDLDVTDSVNGTDGKVWYKVLINANEYGYIRSDFVTLASGEQAPSSTTTTTTTETTEITQIDPQRGHTSTNNVKVRKQATTNSEEVDRLSQDQIFNISGTAQGPDGKMWYYVSYVDGGASKKGFIRSDLVTVLEEEVEEEPNEPQDETQDEVIEGVEEDTSKPNIPAPTKHYEAVYTTDGNGEYIWYLYDETAGQRYKIDKLLTVGKEEQEKIDDLTSANFGLKIGLIITLFLLLMLGGAIAFYIFKMREEQEENSYRRKPQSQGTARTQNVARSQGAIRTQAGARSQTVVKTQNTEKSRSNVRPQTLAKPQSVSEQRTSSQIGASDRKTVNAQGTQSQNNKLSWKAKNFLEDNDELEFGFLDFDEDDE